MSAPPPNGAMLADAIAHARSLLASAERGFIEAQRGLVRMGAAESLERALVRILVRADRCAPTLEEIKLQPGAFGIDACELRFAVDAASDALNQAAGRAVVVAMLARTEAAASGADCGAEPEAR